MSLAAIALGILAVGAPPAEIKVVTFNVLVEISSKPGVPSWRERKDLCIQALKAKDPDILGLQEPTPRQVEFFLEELPDYTAIVAEEFPDVALLYKPAVFTERERGHWWLSPTPEKRSRGFGNFIPRILVWAKLTHKATGRDLYVFNTHFDNTQPSQKRMAELCETKMAPFRESGLPMIFLGDFNTDQKRGDYARLTSNGWRDSYTASPRATPDGRDDNVSTMRGEGRIDHIFYRGPGLEAITWERFDSPDPARPLSDHYPVFAVLRLE